MSDSDFYRVIAHWTKQILATNLTYQQALDLAVKLRMKLPSFDVGVEHVHDGTVTSVV